jgi:hypothetical protein
MFTVEIAYHIFIKKTTAMYKKIGLIAIIGVTLYSQSCCTKKECIGILLNQVEFYNFNKTDLEAVKIFVYEKNTGYSVLLDSVTTQAEYYTDHHTAYSNRAFNKDNDYKIINLKTNDTYLVNDFVTKREKCNSCFPFNPDSDKYDVVVGYSVNGVKQSGSQIKIYK